MSLFVSSGEVETSWSVFVSLACCPACSGIGGVASVFESGSNRTTSSRSKRSRAESSSFGNSTWRVRRTDRSAGDACFSGLAGGVVAVVVGDVFRDWMSDVMKARDCGRFMLLSS